MQCTENNTSLIHFPEHQNLRINLQNGFSFWVLCSQALPLDPTGTLWPPRCANPKYATVGTKFVFSSAMFPQQFPSVFQLSVGVVYICSRKLYKKLVESIWAIFLSISHAFLCNFFLLQVSCTITVNNCLANVFVLYWHWNAPLVWFLP